MPGGGGPLERGRSSPTASQDRPQPPFAKPAFALLQCNSQGPMHKPGAESEHPLRPSRLPPLLHPTPGRVDIAPGPVDIAPIRAGSCRSAGRREGGVDFPQPRRRPHGHIRGCRRSYIPPRAASISPRVASTSSQSAPVHVGAPAGANAASITPNHVAGRAATFAAAAAPTSHPGPCRYRPGSHRHRPGSRRHRPNPHRFM